MWIWERAEWPAFELDEASLGPILREVAELAEQLGVRVGKGERAAQEDFSLNQLIDSVVDSYEIEGEHLQRSSVRSSFIQSFHGAAFTSKPGDAQAEALSSLYRELLTTPNRRFTHGSFYRIHAAVLDELTAVHWGHNRGAYREKREPMRVVSAGPGPNERIHYEAPPSSVVFAEMQDFIDWLNAPLEERGLAPWLELALAHLWFLSIHPFDDGNGRSARVLSDWMMMRIRADGHGLAPLTTTIQQHKQAYGDLLEETQRGALDVTRWCAWFLERVLESLHAALEQWELSVARTRRTALFWDAFSAVRFRDEQKKLIERLLEGGEGNFPQGIKRSQYQSMARVAAATATRHLQELVALGVLIARGEGKATRYSLNSAAFDAG